MTYDSHQRTSPAQNLAQQSRLETLEAKVKMERERLEDERKRLFEFGRQLDEREATLRKQLDDEREAIRKEYDRLNKLQSEITQA